MYVFILGSTALSPTLRKVTVQVISNTDCAKFYSFVTAGTICSSGVGNKGLCNVSQRLISWRQSTYFGEEKIKFKNEISNVHRTMAELLWFINNKAVATGSKLEFLLSFHLKDARAENRVASPELVLTDRGLNPSLVFYLYLQLPLLQVLRQQQLKRRLLQRQNFNVRHLGEGFKRRLIFC